MAVDAGMETGGLVCRCGLFFFHCVVRPLLSPCMMVELVGDGSLGSP